jgi:site-specific DNA-methyltransferase (adenine-specific)
MSDIWFNVHRIKHRRDRDYHPCQLPEKLMDRIIRLTTDPGDKVFDPFAGVGTTALIAKRLGRDFATCELDPTYVQIANEKIQLASINGLLVLF